MLSRCRMIRPFHHSFPLPAPISKLSLLLGLPVRHRSSLLTGEVGGGGESEPNHTTVRKPGPI